MHITGAATGQGVGPGAFGHRHALQATERRTSSLKMQLQLEFYSQTFTANFTMGKTFRRATTNFSDCIRVGGFSSTQMRFNPCGWTAHAEMNLRKVSSRRCRPDGALKNKGNCREPARSSKNLELTSSWMPRRGIHSLSERSEFEDRILSKFEEAILICIDCSQRMPRSHPSYAFLRYSDGLGWSAAECTGMQQPASQLGHRVCGNKPRVLQQLGETFEEKLANGVAADVSQLCMTYLQPHIAALKCEGQRTAEIHVPLCLDFNVNTVDCVSLQLVMSRKDMNDANTRPWCMTAACERALGSALKLRVASQLGVHPSAVSVSSKLSLGYSRYTYKTSYGRTAPPLLYLWSTGLVPHATVTVYWAELDERATAAAALADLHCVRQHLRLWKHLTCFQTAGWKRVGKRRQKIAAADDFLELARKTAEVQAEEETKSDEFTETEQTQAAVFTRRIDAGRGKHPLRLAVYNGWTMLRNSVHLMP